MRADPTRPLSLLARSAWASLLALVAFLGVTGFALDRAYYEGTRTAERDRLQSYLYAYLAGFDMRRDGTLIPPDAPPQPDFDRPGSGLYAVISDRKGTRWSSRSARGRELPAAGELQPGQTDFRGPLYGSSVGHVFVLSEGIAWDVPDGTPRHLTLHIAESDQAFERQIGAYRRTLSLWLLGLGVVLLAMQQMLLRWSLSPLRRVRAELLRVQRGVASTLSDDYPPEISGLTRGFNTIIRAERENLERQRNTLSDLAHSLKTPLAVIRARFESGADAPPQVCHDVLEQVRRMDGIVAYQLSRSAAKGRQTFAAPVRVAPHAESLVLGLEKVYAARQVLCEFDIDPDAHFYGSEGDLLEILGNLVENAFKWARSRVLLSVHRVHETAALREGLEIVVEDDGPGIPPERVEHLLQRGARGDERVQGHGIGLAIVVDLVHAYRAELAVSRSGALGGAHFRLRFPPIR